MAFGPGTAVFESNIIPALVPIPPPLMFKCLAFKCNYWKNVMYFPLVDSTKSIYCKQGDAEVSIIPVTNDPRPVASLYDPNNYSGSIICPNAWISGVGASAVKKSMVTELCNI